MFSSYKFVLLIMIFNYYCCCYGRIQQEEQDNDQHFIVRTIEKLPVHTEVVNLRRLLLSDNISDSISTDFSLAKRDEFPYMYFLINHSSRGLLTIRKEIDRDELCRLRRCRCDTWCDLELEIFVNSEQFNIELVIIRILDKNDHKPQFLTLNNQLNLTIVENAPIGAMIKIEPAIDYDQGSNGIVGYSLLSSRSLPFSLRYDLTRADLSLVVDENLDRELISSYQFQIIAYDGGNQTGILNVYITVDDVNDCPPKFSQSTYTLKNISENLPIGSILYQIHATDDDEGVNSDITYNLINNEKNCFEIDQINGFIRLTCSLDYETKNIYRLNVEAKDGGEGSKTDFCTLIIHLIDENDNYPIIDYYPNDIKIDTNTIRLYLSEALPINSLILSLTIIDRDSGDNGRVTWALNRSSPLTPFELVRLTENTGEIRTKSLFDREHIAEYNLVFDAHDHGKPKPKTSKLNINIIILDENDNKPKFRQENIHSTISEHVKINHTDGYEVYRIQADDFDYGHNGEIMYSILNKDNYLFKIDSQTGIIRALGEFDRKQKDTFVLNIEARDKGLPSLSSETTITFTIIPRNEYAPVCMVENNTTSLSIMENSKNGIILSRILCYDNDKDDLNGQMSVNARWWPDGNLSNTSKTNIPFEIISQKINSTESTMEISIQVNGTIDRELISFYVLVLTITDHGNPSQSTNLTYSIEILDENDNCPQLHIETSFLLINRDITLNNYSLHLIASDNDQGINSEITFELSPLTSPSFIRLYSNGTLFIQLNSSLTNLNDSLSMLHIQIRDHGQPTPCLIVETLRLFIGSNKTDWLTVIKNNDETSARFISEENNQIGTVFTLPSSSPVSVSSLITRKKSIFIIILSILFVSILLITLISCSIDRLHKKLQKRKTLIKTNHLKNSNPYNLTNGKRIANCSPTKTRFCYEDDSPTHHYTNLKSLKPVIVIASSSSQSSSTSVDSTTRINTVHNRTVNSTYSYIPIGTSDELMPGEYDDDMNSGIELMMTTV